MNMLEWSSHSSTMSVPTTGHCLRTWLRQFQNFETFNRQILFLQFWKFIILEYTSWPYKAKLDFWKKVEAFWSDLLRMNMIQPSLILGRTYDIKISPIYW